MEDEKMDAVLARIRSMGDKLADDLSLLPDKPTEKIEPALSLVAEPMTEPVPQVLRRRRRANTKHTEQPVAAPLDLVLDGVEDFIVTPDGRALMNPDAETVQNLIKKDVARPPMPSAPAEEYSAQEIVGEFSKEEVLKKFGVRARKDGAGLEIDPNLPIQPLPTPLSPEEEARASELIRRDMMKPVELDAEDADLEKQQESEFAVAGSAEEAVVLREYGLLPKEAAVISEETVQADALLETLKNDLDAAREHYVSVDLEKSSALLRLRNLFGLKQGSLPLEDIEDARTRYEQARLGFIQERLTRIERKYAGDRSDAYKREMAEVLSFGEFEGRVQLYEARKQAEIKRKSSSLHGRIGEKLSQWMHAYNGLKWYEKLTIGGALVGVTAAGGAAAFGAAFARAVLAGGSLSVTLDAALEGRADTQARAQAKEAGQKIFDKIAEIEAQTGNTDLMTDMGDEAWAEKARAFEASVKLFAEQHVLATQREASGLFRERVDAMKRRKLLIGVSGAALGLVVGKGWIGEGMQHVMDHGTGIGWLDRSFGLAALPDETFLPEARAAANPVVAPVEAQPAASAVPERIVEVSQAPVEGFSSEYANFLKTANVKAGDNFWNLVQERTGGFGLNEGQSKYLIDLIKDKAATLSPTQVRELGISSGDIAKLQSGDRIDFTRLLGSKDLDVYLSQAKGVSSATMQNVLEHKVDVVPPAERVYLKGVNEKLQALMTENVAVSPVARVATEAAQSSTLAFSPEYAPRVDDWYAQIFRVENPTPGQDWVLNRSEILQVKVADVIRDTQAFAAGQMTGYRSGLAPEQYRNFYEFAASLQKTGVVSMTEFLRGNVNGTVEEYLKQAAPRATQGTVYGIFSTSR